MKPYSRQYLQDLPQHAYLPYRSTSSAVSKALSHCYQIRCLLQSQNINIHNSRERHKKRELVGGLVLSVDLSRAFDSLPFWLLSQALQQAAVPLPLRELILAFHARVCFHVADSVAVRAGQGIRQGCPLAPQLWAIASGCVMRMIQARTAEAFVRDCLTLYADGHLGSWTITDFASLRRSLREAAVVLDVLKECCFDVSTDKSAFLRELRGTRASQTLQSVTCRLPTGKGVRAGQWTLPLKQSHPYLGVMLSFRNFELETYRYRKDKAVRAALSKTWSG